MWARRHPKSSSAVATDTLANSIALYLDSPSQVTRASNKQDKWEPSLFNEPKGVEFFPLVYALPAQHWADPR